MTPSAMDQFLACVSARTGLTEDQLPAGARTRLSDRHGAEIDAWVRAFRAELQSTRAGYASGQVHRTPGLEDALVRLIDQAGIASSASLRPGRPQICLSHDVDYLEVTPQMRIKNLISQKRLQLGPDRTDYVGSLARLLELDRQGSGRGEASTVFMAAHSTRGLRLLHPMRWLIDPSYRPHEPNFERLRKVLEDSRCEVGLHGSFYSLRSDLIRREREQLSQDLGGRPIRASRQHWLNLPQPDSLQRLSEAGFEVDSTLGWNGQVGFRGGMSFPFPILLVGGRTLWEVPMPLMDGVLFQDLGLGADEAYTLGIEVLSAVARRGGCVSINWHERAADPTYGWDVCYERLIRWAKAEGFEFQSIPEAMQRWKPKGAEWTS